MKWRAISARPCDAEVRRRGWVHLKPLNFPQPEEQAAYMQAGERCDERGLPLSLAPEPPLPAAPLVRWFMLYLREPCSTYATRVESA